MACRVCDEGERAEAVRDAQPVEQSRRGPHIESEFVALLAHELRNPLNVVLSSLELLLEGEFGDLTADQAEQLRRVARNASEMVDVVNAALDLSRADAVHATLKMREISVASLLHEIDEGTRHLQRRPHVPFVWHVAPDLPPLCIDPVKLKIVLKNLVVNALKFTTQGGVMLDVHRAENCVEFSVIDTGPGIPAEALPIIFDAFRQVETPQPQRGSGVGLGLYIARRLVELMGGTIAVDSALGRGSVFRVRLPLAPAPAAC